ncbi:MAG: hypothetical protein LRY69_05580, partial [Gammaproteobacteria bacterium]|nr:hypothetical protein [Gammaproteobacteria bacterium]
VLAAGNLIPSLGFSFSTMANFDLLNFLSVLLFLKIPQVQRALGSFFYCFTGFNGAYCLDQPLFLSIFRVWE